MACEEGMVGEVGCGWSWCDGYENDDSCIYMERERYNGIEG